MDQSVCEYMDRRIDKTAECWEWTGSVYGNGYGRLRCAPNTGALAHRVAYARWVGPLVDGLTIDHLCRNRRCVNPAHLEQVTITENVRRSSRTQSQMARTHCPQGHEYSESNTLTYRGMRQCITCRQEHGLRYLAKNRDAKRDACRARYYAKTGRPVPVERKACGPRWEGSKIQRMVDELKAA
jgi:hypothetical protein